MLGIDPGSKITGYAMLVDGKLEECGTIGQKSGVLAKRLRVLRNDLLEILDLLKPTHCCVETPFVGRFPGAVIGLAQARGVLIETLAHLPMMEVDPKQAKNAVGCKGNAEKEMVMLGVERLLGQKMLTPDAADAVALALAGASRFRAAQTSPE